MLSEVTLRATYGAVSAPGDEGGTICASTLQGYNNGLSQGAAYLRMAGCSLSSCDTGLILNEASNIEIENNVIYGPAFAVILGRGVTDARLTGNTLLSEEVAVAFLAEGSLGEPAPERFDIEIVGNSVRGSLPEHDPSIGVTVADNTAID